MSLIRLLTTGRSLVNIRDGDSRYHVTSQRLLPHFGARQNPFSSSEKAEPAQAAQTLPRDPAPKVTPPPAPSTPASGGERKASPGSKQTGWAAFIGSGLRALAAGLRRWTAAFLDACRVKLAELFANRRSKAAKPAIPRFDKAPVQTELSLDRIKVLRNDLSDADLEVVPAKAPVMPVAPATQPVEKPAVAESACGRVPERVVGSSKS